MASAPILIKPPTPTEPSESSDPHPLQKLLELIAHLPPGLRADWDGTNHYEMTTSFSDIDYWWLDLSDYLVQDFDSATEIGKRVGLLLDLAESAKAAEQHLQNIHEALAELNQRNGLNNDEDAYLLALVEWAQGQRPARPAPQDFGQPALRQAHPPPPLLRPRLPRPYRSQKRISKFIPGRTRPASPHSSPHILT